MANQEDIPHACQHDGEQTGAVYNEQDNENGFRERSSSDMTRLLNVPELCASLKFPSAPIVAAELSEEIHGASSPDLEYQLRERYTMENESRLGVYCSPRFYRKKNFAASYVGETLREGGNDFDSNMDNSPTDSNGSSARSELSKRAHQENIRKKRPLSLVGIDSRRKPRESQNGKPLPDGITNLGSSCCNLRTSLMEKEGRIRSPSSRGNQGTNLSPWAERTPTFQLSRSCSDLRDGVNTSPLHPTIQELRCPSHVSLQSIRVSSPSESRLSLLSDLELYERAHHYPRHADSPPLYPDVGCPELSSTALVQEWLSRQEKYSKQTSEQVKQRAKFQPR